MIQFPKARTQPLVGAVKVVAPPVLDISAAGAGAVSSSKSR